MGSVRPIDVWAEVAGFLAVHDGVATIADLRECGVTRRAVAGRVTSGELIRVATGIYLSAQHEYSDAARLRIGMHLAGGVADRGSALFWHGFSDRLPPVITATVPAERRVRPSAGFRIDARRGFLGREDIAVVRNLRVTAEPLTVLQAADPSLMDRALQTGRVNLRSLQRALDRNAHRTGIAAARRVLEVAGGDSESEAERRFERLLREHGITGFVIGLRLGRYKVDFAFPEQQVAVEINGWAYHRSHSRFLRDQEKHNALALAGWLPLNFSWHHIVSDPEAVVDTLLAALNERAA